MNDGYRTRVGSPAGRRTERRPRLVDRLPVRGVRVSIFDSGDDTFGFWKLTFWLAWHLVFAIAAFAITILVIGLLGAVTGLLDGRDSQVQGLALVAAVPAIGLWLKGWYDVSRWWLDRGGRRSLLILADCVAAVAAVAAAFTIAYVI